MNLSRSRWFCVSLCWCATAVIAEPLPIRDLNPLLSGYELPPALPSTPFEHLALAAEFSIGNLSLNQHTAHESLQLDGELERWQFSFSKPISESLGMRIELPYVRISGGHLDSFIESVHKTFGFTNGNRDLVPTKRLLIQHTRDAQVDFSLSKTQHGIGDVTLRMAQRLGREKNANPAFNNTLWVSLKLPTGDARKLTGSDSVDIAISLAGTQQLGERFETQQQVSMSLLGHGERLSDQQNKTVWSGSLGVDAKVTQHWSAAMQLYGHTRVFTTDLRGLGPALQLSLGPRYQSNAWSGEFVISEDLAIDTAPDVQFQLGITRRY